MRGWAVATIGELLTIQNGFAFDSKNFSVSKGAPLIRIRDLKGGSTTETKIAGLDDIALIEAARDGWGVRLL
jgi:type I restriction enzyme S subunit